MRHCVILAKGATAAEAPARGPPTRRDVDGRRVQTADSPNFLASNVNKTFGPFREQDGDSKQSFVELI